MTAPVRTPVLVADDDPSTIVMLTSVLRRWSLDVVAAADGVQAWQCLQGTTMPIAILDWEMPGMSGPELCRRIRQDPSRSHMHLILLTSRSSRADLVAGLDAGADDYLTKPYDHDELRARVHVGLRIAALQQRLTERVADLQSALSRVKQLSGLLPICSYCKRIRSDHDYWEQVESYLAHHTDAEFSHGICPHCYKAIQAQFDALQSITQCTR